MLLRMPFGGTVSRTLLSRTAISVRRVRNAARHGEARVVSHALHQTRSAEPSALARSRSGLGPVAALEGHARDAPAAGRGIAPPVAVSWRVCRGAAPGG